MRKLFTSLGLLIIAHAALKGFENEPYKNALTINKGTHISFNWEQSLLPDDELWPL